MKKYRDIIYGDFENYYWFYNIYNSNLIFKHKNGNFIISDLYNQLNNIGFNNELKINYNYYETFHISINISNACNFKCNYCFAEHPFTKVSLLILIRNILFMAIFMATLLNKGINRYAKSEE